MRILYILFIVSLYSFHSLYSQEKYKISASYTEETITLDGIDNEVSWSKASMISDEFNGIIPIAENKGSQKNEIKIIYDDKFLYVFAKAYTTADKVGEPSLKRDARTRGADAILVMFDTYSDATNAFWFESTSSGVKKDALISNGGQRFETDIDFSWDIKFDVKTVKHVGYYSAEFKIPFSSMKFPEGSRKWKVNFLELTIYTLSLTHGL